VPHLLYRSNENGKRIGGRRWKKDTRGRKKKRSAPPLSISSFSPWVGEKEEKVDIYKKKGKEGISYAAVDPEKMRAAPERGRKKNRKHRSLLVRRGDKWKMGKKKKRESDIFRLISPSGKARAAMGGGGGEEKEKRSASGFISTPREKRKGGTVAGIEWENLGKRHWPAVPSPRSGGGGKTNQRDHYGAREKNKRGVNYCPPEFN